MLYTESKMLALKACKKNSNKFLIEMLLCEWNEKNKNYNNLSIYWIENRINIWNNLSRTMGAVNDISCD